MDYTANWLLQICETIKTLPDEIKPTGITSRVRLHANFRDDPLTVKLFGPPKPLFMSPPMAAIDWIWRMWVHERMSIDLGSLIYLFETRVRHLPFWIEMNGYQQDFIERYFIFQICASRTYFLDGGMPHVFPNNDMDLYLEDKEAFYRRIDGYNYDPPVSVFNEPYTNPFEVNKFIDDSLD